MQDEDYITARNYVETLLSTERGIGREAGVTAGLVLLAEVLLVLGNFDDAKRHLRDVLFHRELRDSEIKFDSIRVAGLVLASEGRYDHALKLLSFVSQQPEYSQVNARIRNDVERWIQICRSALPAGKSVTVADSLDQPTYETMAALVNSTL